MIIKLTKHAKMRLEDRGLTFERIEEVIKNYDFLEEDKIDPLITHYIKKIDKKFLRVIAKKEDKETLLVISAFYDRRLKRMEE